MATKNLQTTSGIGKHTPGPYYVDGNSIMVNRPEREFLGEGAPETICDMISSVSPEETKANARLMAAAPELLHALRQCLEQMDYLRRNLSPAKRRFTAPTTNAAEELAINAISKALGGAQ